MSKGVNKWIGIGNACNDPDCRFLPSGSAVTNVDIACNDSYKDKQTGQKVETVEYVKLVFFGKLAEIVGEYVRKGSKIYVEGAMKTEKWQDKQGNDRWTTKVKCDEMNMLDSRDGSAASNPQPSQQAAPQPGESGNGFDDFNDDLEF